MVGHRFVEALRSRDEAGQWQVIVLCEEQCRRTTASACPPTSAPGTAKELALAGNDYAGDDLVDLRLGRAGARPSTAKRTTVDHTSRRRHRLRRAGAGDRLVPVRAAGPRPRPAASASSTAPSTTWTASAPPPERPGPARAVSSSAAVCSGWRRPTRCGCSGMTPHVVEFAPRLMPLQVDEGGGAVLRRLVTESRPPRPHRASAPPGSSPTDRRRRARGRAVRRLDDRRRRCWCSPPACARGTSWPATPASRSASAAASSPTSRCGTSDPSVYAIGECAAVEGRCYGLVAPGYTTAEIVADRLLGGAGEFPGADMSTKLKLMGVDVASFGDAHGTTDGALEVVLQRRGQGHLRQARRLRRREDPARRHPRRRRVRVRDAAPAGRSRSCPATRRR